MRRLWILMLILPLPASTGLSAEHTKDSLETVKQKIEAGQAVLVDVREQAEWDAAHVQGAILVPLSKLRDPDQRKAAAAKLPKDKVLYCHCRSGRRSLAGSDVLKALGYQSQALKPGLREILDAGFKQAQE